MKNNSVERPEFFSQIVGHTYHKEMITRHIANGTLPHFIIFAGPEGLGKTAIADLIALDLVYGSEPTEKRHQAYLDIIANHKSSTAIRRYEMSEDGTVETAQAVKNDLQGTLSIGTNKVIILDECHNMHSAAQDVILPSCEFIKDNVYVLLMTTELDKLKKPLQSRGLVLYLNPLTMTEAQQVLRHEILKRNLNIQEMTVALPLIAEWSECKPRKGLKLLEAFPNGSSVSLRDIRALTASTPIREILPLLATLSGSLTTGLNLISEMVVNDDLPLIVTDCILIRSGNHSARVSIEDMRTIREQLSEVTIKQLSMFLKGITSASRVSRRLVINAYLSAHSMFDVVCTKDTREYLVSEINTNNNREMATEYSKDSAPTLESLMKGADIIKE